jgi:hypothetical protein
MRDDAEEIIRKSREILARRDRERELEKWRARPDDVLYRDESLPITDWRGCKSTKEMSGRQFSKWVDDGKPPLTSAKPPREADLKVTKSQVDAAINQERANLQSSLQTLAEIIGDETGKADAKLAKQIEQLRAELDALRNVHEQRGGDAIIDLPDWRSDHVEH